MHNVETLLLPFRDKSVEIEREAACETKETLAVLMTPSEE
jgi:hypothetical protein